MVTPPKKRETIARCLKTLRAYRKEHRLCRECGSPLEDEDSVRCFRCKVKHSTSNAVLYHRKKEQRLAIK